MKYGGIIFAILTAFFAVVAVMYGVWSRDPIGTTALAFTGFQRDQERVAVVGDTAQLV